MAMVEMKMTKAETDAQTIRSLEAQLANARKDLQEYIMSEKVMIAAGKVSQDVVDKAHDIARSCS